MFAIGIAIALPAEQHGSQVLRDSGVNIASGDGSERRQHVRQGGALRDRAPPSIWAVATTNASNGSVNGGHDALTATGGAVPIVNMFTGEVIFGGVGSGLYGMFFYIVIAVFVAGLMVGRTPEYLGKKIEAERSSSRRSARSSCRDGARADGDRHRAPIAGSRPSSTRARTASPRRSTPTTRSRTTTAAPSPATARRSSRRSSARSRSGSDASRRSSPRSRSAARWPPRRRCRRRRARSARRHDLRVLLVGVVDPHRRPDDLPGAHAGADRGGALLMRTLGRSVIAVVVLTLVFGLAYPLALHRLRAASRSRTADGSLIERNGTVVGSQPRRPGVHVAASTSTRGRRRRRPSTTPPPRRSPTSARPTPISRRPCGSARRDPRSLSGRTTRASTLGDIPVDAVTTSGSGIDPHISPANAQLQTRARRRGPRPLAGPRRRADRRHDRRALARHLRRAGRERARAQPGTGRGDARDDARRRHLHARDRRSRRFATRSQARPADLIPQPGHLHRRARQRHHDGDLLPRPLLVGRLEPLWFTGTIALWLWLTVLFANFAEAVAEGRGKAQANALRATRTTTMAFRRTDERRPGGGARARPPAR